MLRKTGNVYEEIDTIFGTTTPIVVATARTNGWNDLIIWKRGYSDEPSHYEVLQWDGKTWEARGG